MRKTLMAVLAAAAAATLGLATPAAAHDPVPTKLRNIPTGKCLAAVPANGKISLRQDDCGAPHTDWQFQRLTGRAHMIKSPSLNKCLDGNQAGGIYLSDCLTYDVGQVYRMTCGDHGAIVNYRWETLLTGWTGGSVSFAEADDTNRKQHWAYTQTDGCGG
ncbi:RICIN domain-containing protein [Streptomyces sp. AC627_RSS907]|uniref:RICIN domain-containing protein n=1 Tax=Streptomyces sp. AC627_RSS907 TaxID=2823684 RepID=UPI001C22987A|nr:RICIN domain-containing protein [Streptomyces sp. AC627_RSS907]